MMVRIKRCDESGHPWIVFVARLGLLGTASYSGRVDTRRSQSKSSSYSVENVRMAPVTFPPPPPLLRDDDDFRVQFASRNQSFGELITSGKIEREIGDRRLQ